MTVTQMRKTLAPPTTIQPRLVGVAVPPPGAAKQGNPESPNTIGRGADPLGTEMLKRK